MGIKKIVQKLSQITDDNNNVDLVTKNDKDDLLELIQEALIENSSVIDIPKNISPYLPEADNDNKSLSTEQKFRLRLIEKTGTGLSLIHI